jgi:hypothetical protein
LFLACLPNNWAVEVIAMLWSWSDALLSTFQRKYEPLVRQLGHEVEISERVVRHVGGLERIVTIAVFHSVHRKHLVISEVFSRDGHWIRVAPDGDYTGVKRKQLDEFIWKAFYHQANKIVASCVVAFNGGHARFSLKDGLEYTVGNETIKLPPERIGEVLKAIAISKL